MTILTKTGDKKLEKGILPLFAQHEATQSEIPPAEIIEHLERRRFSYRLLIILFLVAMMVLCFGIIGGSILARHFAKQPLERLRFHGYCSFPYLKDDIDSQALMYSNNRFADNAKSNDIFSIFDDQDLPSLDQMDEGKFFKEELDLDMSDEEGFAKIEVPDFRDGRSGRFMHDFKFNQSAIVDKENGRCFVMPLDRETVLPPDSLYDLVRKMWSGYYDLDMDVVKKNMRVVVPALKDLTDISPRIVEDCSKMRVYQLEKMIRGVFKRSVDLHPHSKFAEFSGKMVEINIHNMDEVIASENIN